MNSHWLALMGSADMEPTLKKLQSDAVLDFAEYSLLRESAQAKFNHLLSSLRTNPDLVHKERTDSVQKLQEVEALSLQLAALIQSSCLYLRRSGLEKPDRRLARQALECQLAYLQACLRRSLDSFDTF
ncbi:hypothetical protein RTH46_21390 [Pseudomonas sp. zfem004]|uniref:hypothetical protein n=1 Tax=unclassified Pseudomonas TaxID=196821 RepID=UPI00129B9E60|nr:MULTISPECIES: hypothetical protein [unclassified Pseudomonas]MDU9405044.1 hypothetical protein [Pseudomonas sp. zfem004]